ncbi:MAG TPA: branched-chain amino acid ABC transporter permease [Candidatus Polarisedimenticolaceae bacterium]|nr:branched-chain amino acid ABC transporter permease [Candidatus Polarisedimenticolaceae bacterium]
MNRLLLAGRSVFPLLVGVALSTLVAFGLQPLMKQFHVKVLTDIGINVVLAVSLTMVNGFTGQFSLGHAAFMALGGYAAVALTYYGSFLLWGTSVVQSGFLAPGQMLFAVACVLGGVVAAGFGWVVGLPSLRLRGDYLAIVTLGFAEIVRILIQQTGEVKYTLEAVRIASPLDLATSLGGSLGFTGIPKYTSLFWVGLAVTAVLVVAHRLKASSYGRAFLSIREDEIAAEAMGVPVARYKVQAFVLAAFFAGIAGALFAHEVGTALNPVELGFQKSIEIVIMVVLGGMGSVSGAAFAAVLVTVLPEWLRQPTHLWPLGVVLMGAVLLLSRGRNRRGAAVLGAVVLVAEIARTIALARGVNLAEYRMIFYSTSLILMMILRPQGLLGIREIWETGPVRALTRRWDKA